MSKDLGKQSRNQGVKERAEATSQFSSLEKGTDIQNKSCLEPHIDRIGEET